jgi:hypothetical protein
MSNMLAKCFSRPTPSVKAWSLPSPDLECADIVRESPEYRTAFIVNILCIAVPLFIFYVMCAREFLVRLQKLEKRMRSKISSDFLFFLLKGIGRILWLCPLSVICAPFFIIYIPIRQVENSFSSNIIQITWKTNLKLDVFRFTLSFITTELNARISSVVNFR